MPITQLQNSVLQLKFAPDGGLTITAPQWKALNLGPLTPSLVVNGEALGVVKRIVEPAADDSHVTLTTEFAPLRLTLVQEYGLLNDATIRLHSQLHNRTGQEVTLNRVDLLAASAEHGSEIRLAEEPTFVRTYGQGYTWARVSSLGVAPKERKASAEMGEETIPSRTTEVVWLGYDMASKMALLAGFETSERWLGRLLTEGRPGEHPLKWLAWLDGGDTLIPAGSVVLEDLLLMAGGDPVVLLEQYADQVAKRHNVQILPESPVSWCSWYPYRLGVTEERIQAIAEIGAERLRPLGLKVIEVDLGWERNWLPNAFEENDQFPHGLKQLSEYVEERGFILGAWKGPICISDLDSIPKEHPEWLLGGEGKKPLPLGQWFWEPHGETYALDLTHPGAQQWLRQKMRSLAQRGVRYFKPDFIGSLTSSRLRERYDRHIVAGGGMEAARIAMQIIREEMEAGDPNALILNCGLPDIPGKGCFNLLYSCADTGNTGYVGWAHLREDYGRNTAGHLFKNRRWGIIQPSCCCVGLPGTLEEARVRATATFLSGGQVDISDELTTLPEDRWQVLLATLPPLGISARPLDLFEPFPITPANEAEDHPPSRVWHLRVEGGWDTWDLYGLFNYEVPPNEPGAYQPITQFRLPLERLGLDPNGTYWVHEFWSGQFLGTSPFVRENPHGYKHPGDMQPLIASPNMHEWEVSFFGPAVKLLVVRHARLHPWVAATSFHQSGGTELANVTWDGDVLRGDLRRPAGQEGYLVIAGAPTLPRSARVGGGAVKVHPGANGSILVPVVTRGDVTSWELRWD
jgi:hypothetical protein